MPKSPITEPMLASPCEDMSKIKFPVLATPKLDGIRCLKVNSKAVSRKFKPIANKFVREWIEKHLPDGLDGELMVRNVPFSQIAGHIAKHTGEPDFEFMVFDYVRVHLDTAYEKRITALKNWYANLAKGHPARKRVTLITPRWIEDAEQLRMFEQVCLDKGYEGVMIRTADSPYKCGRSTLREGYLLKIKQFVDDDAEIIGCYERCTNQNEAEQDAFGRTKRSSAQAGIVGTGELGGFDCRCVTTGQEFSVGYNHVLGGICRKKLWKKRKTLPGKFIKYKHQPVGRKDKPRFPQFLAFREEWDM